MLNNNYNPRQNILAKILFFCITQAAPEKKPLPQFQCCWPQAPCSAWPRTTLIIGGRGTGFCHKFCHRVVWKMKKAKKRTGTISMCIRNKFWLFTMPSGINGLLQWLMLVHGKENGNNSERNSQLHVQCDSTELKTKQLQISTLCTTQNKTTIYKTRLSATEYIFSYIQDQNTNLYVQWPMNYKDRKTVFVPE